LGGAFGRLFLGVSNMNRTTEQQCWCGDGTLHATLIPPKWTGDRWWIVALKGEVIGDDEKYGALEREIIGECL